MATVHLTLVAGLVSILLISSGHGAEEPEQPEPAQFTQQNPNTDPNNFNLNPGFAQTNVADPVSGSGGFTGEQRNYQPGQGSTYNLDFANEDYALDYNYHNYEQMTKFLRSTGSRFPRLTALYSIGKSVQGRDLWVLVVSSSPYEHMIGKPDVKYVANMHGNEAVSRELMLHLIHVNMKLYTYYERVL